ncbi:MAG: conjugal transfer protein TrbI [Acidobacteriota bacterium]|nr:conjugal transfer protein TrbI [Acidobacteriota bacterium]
MAETPHATVPEQPEASTPLGRKQPLLILLFLILLVLVVSTVVNASRKAAPLKSQLTASPATANPQQVHAFEAQQQESAKKDQEEQVQRAAAAALLVQLQAEEAPGPEAASAPPLTPAQRAAMYGVENPDAPRSTSPYSERQAEAKEAALARERQRQEARDSDTVVVDFAQQPTGTAVHADHASEPPPATPSMPSKTESVAPASEPAEASDAAIHSYDFDRYDGKLFRIFEGSFFEGVVTNHIDGGLAGPILIMLTTDYYSHDHQQLLLPQGTRLIGTVQAVNNSQARRMVVTFHRAICPDGFSVDLANFAGLDPIGTTGLATKVDNRYLQSFAVAAVLGGLGGLAQIGNDASILTPSVEIRTGIASQTSQEAEQMLNHFLNRLPIITLKEGSRARIYIGRDLLVPSYAEHRVEPAL